MLIHRVAYELYHQKLLGVLIIDHIDHNKLNNKISNLRATNREENNKNLGIRRTNKSGIPGIEIRYTVKNEKRYITEIRVKTKKIHLGSFKNKEDAIKARKMALRIYGFHKNHK